MRLGPTDFFNRTRRPGSRIGRLRTGLPGRIWIARAGCPGAWRRVRAPIWMPLARGHGGCSGRIWTLRLDRRLRAEAQWAGMGHTCSPARPSSGGYDDEGARRASLGHARAGAAKFDAVAASAPPATGSENPPFMWLLRGGPRWAARGAARTATEYARLQRPLGALAPDSQRSRPSSSTATFALHPALAFAAQLFGFARIH